MSDLKVIPRGEKPTPKEGKTRIEGRWQNAAPGDVARLLIGNAAQIEKWSWNRRWLNMVCSRYVSGRDVLNTFSFSMSRRPLAIARSMGAATWSAPNFNLIATAADVFSSRIWKNRPYIEVLPLAAGGFKARVRAKKLSRYFDGVANETRFWSTVELIGIDAMTTGMGVVKIHESVTQPGRIAVTRVLPDEILVSEDEAIYQEPHTLIQRVFLHREDLLARYGKDPVASDAIRRAPAAYPAFYFGGEQFRDIVCLVEGWSKPTPDGKPGRHVLAVPGFALVDEDYTSHRFPFAFINFKKLSHNWFGQGLAEPLLGTQQEISRLMAAIQEGHERVAWPTVLIEKGSAVNREAFAGVPGRGVKYTGVKPIFETPTAFNAETYNYLDSLITKGFRRVGISEATAGGARQPGLNSGAALMAQSQIEDTRHVDLAQRLEDFVKDVAELVFDLAEEIKPRVTVPGRRGQQIDWADARLTRDSYSCRAFPLSRLPQTIAGREQAINDMEANGEISRTDARRLKQLPDIDSYTDLADATRDLVEDTLDRIVEDGEWIAPYPFGDAVQALQMATSRLALELRLETPSDRTALLSHWILALQDQVDEASASQPAPGGMQAPSGPAPAPSPSQMVPAQGPPQPPPS